MKKSEYKAELVKALEAKGITIDQDKLNSALAKVAIHARNKYGNANWQYEMDESGTYNGVSFYNEYKQQSTFNRDTYRNRSSSIYHGC